jgi:serine/threonine-protein kinase
MITHTHTALTTGAVVASYRILDEIGAGGMGEVCLAEDTRLRHRVAIKFLPPDLTANQDVRSPFLREAQGVARLNHPGIVTIHDVSEVHGRP